MEIKTTHKGAKAPITVNYDFGDNLDVMVEKFGADKVHEAAKQSLVVRLQNYVRGHMQNGKDEKEIQGLVKAWRPDTVAPRVKKTDKERFLEALNKMSPEERAKLVAELTGGKTKAA